MKSLRYYINLVEDLSIGSAIEPYEVPSAYADLPVIGRGATSIVLRKDEDTVVLMTKDPIKAVWLTSQGLASKVGEFTSTKARVPALRKFPIHVIEMPLLLPLDDANREIVEDLRTEFKNVALQAWSANKKRTPGFETKQIIKHFSADEQHRLYPVFQFLKQHPWNRYDFDFEPENFMQTKDGSIVVVDPMISTTLRNVLMRHLPPQQ